MKGRIVNATEFKAKCLSFLDEMEQHGGSITVTRRGHPVAVLGPAKRKAWKSSKGLFAGRASVVGDIVSLDTSGLWDAVRGE
jgi:prevent-host-death family protein